MLYNNRFYISRPKIGNIKNDEDEDNLLWTLGRYSKFSGKIGKGKIVYEKRDKKGWFYNQIYLP